MPLFPLSTREVQPWLGLQSEPACCPVVGRKSRATRVTPIERRLSRHGAHSLAEALGAQRVASGMQQCSGGTYHNLSKLCFDFSYHFSIIRWDWTLGGHPSNPSFFRADDFPRTHLGSTEEHIRRTQARKGPTVFLPDNEQGCYTLHTQLRVMRTHRRDGRTGGRGRGRQSGLTHRRRGIGGKEGLCGKRRRRLGRER